MKATHFLNYNGEVDEMIGRRMGPNLLGQFFVACEQTYDPNTHTTRVGFVLSRRLEQ